MSEEIVEESVAKLTLVGKGVTPDAAVENLLESVPAGWKIDGEIKVDAEVAETMDYYSKSILIWYVAVGTYTRTFDRVLVEVSDGGGGNIKVTDKEVHDLVKIGKAVRGTTFIQQTSGDMFGKGWGEGYNSCLEYIYEKAGLEMPPHS